MKIKALLVVAATLSLSGWVQAQTIINITGATAFRTAATASIDAAFAAGGGTVSKAFNNTDSSGAAVAFSGATYQAWRGNFPGVGPAIVRTSWSGSVEGIRAVVVGGADDPSFVKVGLPFPTNGILPSDGSSNGVAWATIQGSLEVGSAPLAFSDVAVSATPVVGALNGGPVGVVVFTMAANKTWRDDIAANTAGITSVSAQQFRQLAGAGNLPLSFFSNNSAHTTKVYLTGRNDGSGTRTTYLAETGFGIANPVRQYVGYDRTNATAIPSIVLAAKGGGFNSANVAQTAYKSTVWGLDIDGNGGYSSGGDVRTDLTKTSTATKVGFFEDLDESGDYDASEVNLSAAATKIYLLSWLSVADAKTAATASGSPNTGGYILGYNGVRLDAFAADVNTLSSSTGLAAADRAKVVNGSYTAWGYENLFYKPGNATALTVYNDLKGRLNSAAVIANAGIPLTEMNVNRSFDGGTVVPGPLP